MNVAAELRIRAERRMGEALRETELAKGGGDQKSDHRSSRPTSDRLPSLSEIGISKDQSSRFQRLADIPDPVFEVVVVTGHHCV